MTFAGFARAWPFAHAVGLNSLGRLVGFEPVLAPAAIGNQWYTERIGVLHLLNDDALHLFFLVGIDREVQFVVHLQDHLRTDAFLAETLEDANHRHFDDIGRRALNGCIDGVAFSEVANGGVARVDVGQIATAVEHRLGIAALAGQLLRLLHVVVNTWEGLEETIDEQQVRTW